MYLPPFRLRWDEHWVPLEEDSFCSGNILVAVLDAAVGSIVANVDLASGHFVLETKHRYFSHYPVGSSPLSAAADPLVQLPTRVVESDG